MRLSGVTQIATPDPANPTIHNRLTHSLKVAQIARSICDVLIARSNPLERARIKELGGLDAEVAMAAGLAHDLGHPPFGHAGENELDALYQNDQINLVDGFEGNAQSFRIITKTCAVDGQPLRLTAATRAAVLKYPWRRPLPSARTGTSSDSFKFRKFGYYTTEEAEFEDARGWLPDAVREHPDLGPCQSLEASAMDIADDITYSLHDYQDFVRLGLIDPMRVKDLMYIGSDFVESLRSDLEKNYGAFFDPNCYNNLVADMGDMGLGALAKTDLLNGRITWLINSVRVSAGDPRGQTPSYLHLGAEQWHYVQLLKYIPRWFVIAKTEVALMQAGQQSTLRSAIWNLRNWTKSDAKRLPTALNDLIRISYEDSTTVDRAIVDYVCRLGDAELTLLDRKLSGFEAAGILSIPHF